jgi:hypothetical protein
MTRVKAMIKYPSVLTGKLAAGIHNGLISTALSTEPLSDLLVRLQLDEGSHSVFNSLGNR